MKKLSTKIILLSLTNSLIIALMIAGASSVLGNGSGGNAANGGAAAVKAGGTQSFLPPTPVLIAMLIAILIGAVISYIFGKIISKPIIMVTELTKRTAEFNLTKDASVDEVLKLKDESGTMASALIDTREALTAMATKLKSISSTLRTHSIDLTNTTSDNVSSIKQVSSTISEIAQGNSNQASNINEISETLSDVVKLIDKITQDALQGAERAIKSMDTIKDGQQAVDTQVEKVKENIAVSQIANQSIEVLNERIGQVANIVGVINSIADQTNLLSLNAAIEAARVGEAGKGFAVVADEIRKLAEESANATKQIAEIIADTTEKTKLAVGNINKATTLVEEQKDIIGITQNAFSNIREAYGNLVDNFKQTASEMKIANEKSSSVLNQTKAMASLAEASAANAQEVSALGEEQLNSIELIAKSSKNLLAMSEDLNKEVNKFKLDN